MQLGPVGEKTEISAVRARKDAAERTSTDWFGGWLWAGVTLGTRAGTGSILFRVGHLENVSSGEKQEASRGSRDQVA